MMRSLILTFLIMTFGYDCLCQLSLRVGQASDNAFTKGEEAQLQYMNALDTMSETWITQGYLEFGYRHTFNNPNKGKAHNLTFSATGELHRNTQLEKKQHVFQYGGSVDYRLEFLDANQVSVRMINPTLNIKYSEDRLKNEGGIQIIAGVTYFDQISGLNASTFQQLITPGLYTPILWSILGIETDHNISFVYMTQDGKVLSLAQANLELNTYILPDLFDNLFSNYRTIFFKGAWNGRAVIENQTENSTNYLKTFGFGIDLSILNAVQNFNSEARGDENKFNISFEWVDGANPLKGLADQSYKQITFNAVISF